MSSKGSPCPALCRVCLSRRQCEIISRDATLLLLSGHGAIEETTLQLCWECHAVLRKVREFQRRAQTADYLLKRSQTFNYSSLSTLTTVHKDSYDLILKENEVNSDEKEIKNENPQEEVKNEENSNVNVKTEINDDDHFSVFQEQKNFDDIEYSLDETELNGNKTGKCLEVTEICVEVKENCLNAVVSKKISKSLPKKHKNHTVYKLKQQKYKKYMIEVPLVKEEEVTVKIDEEFQQNVKKIKCEETNECIKCEDESTSGNLNACGIATFDYKCDLCNSKFKTEKLFENHFREHKKIFKCNYCKIVFGSSTAVSSHYRELHARFGCDHCSKELSTKNKLIRHIRVHHDKQECNICNRDFPTRNQFLRHRLYVHGMYTKKVETVNAEASYCVECDRQFPSIPLLKKHLSTSTRHRGTRPKRVPCPECGKVFSRGCYMRNHFSFFHSDEVRYRCELCEKRFVSTFSLWNHMRQVHEKKPQPRNKICDACGRGFATNRILTHHIRTHTGERPFACPRCPASFGQKSSMQTHLRTQHADK